MSDGGGGHLSLSGLADIRTWAVIVHRPALTADIHKLIRPHGVDEVTQVFVVKVARQKTWHVDLNKGKENNTQQQRSAFTWLTLH